MKKKSFKLGMLAMALVFGFVVVGCSSAPKTYKVAKTADPSVLQGQKTVVFNLAMAQRKNPGMGAYWAQAFAHMFEGGLFIYPIAGGAAIADFKGKDGQIAAELPVIQAEWQTLFDKSIAELYAQKYSAETVQVAYPFADAKYKITYFSKPNAAIKEQIASICSENGAAYAVAIVGQVVHGTGAGNQMHVSTELQTELCIFDSAGNIVARGNTTTSQVALNPASLENYVTLYAMGQKNTIDLIGALDVKK
jgi:hypothetical protein